MLLGKRMSTNTNSRTNRTLKYLLIEEKKLSKDQIVYISIGSLAFYVRSMDFPYSPRDELGFFNTV